MYGLLMGEVMDLSNTLQLITFIKYYDCQTMLSVHCICHGLALVCSDTGGKLSYLQ